MGAGSEETPNSATDAEHLAPAADAKTATGSSGTEKNAARTGAPRPDGRTKPRKWMTKRKRNVIVVLVIVAVALVIGLWGTAPTNYLTVSDINGNAGSYVNTVIEVKGLVENWNTSGNAFELADSNSRMNVTYTALPEGFNNGKEVVVKGMLKDVNGLLLEASDIKVGCPSKY